MNNKLKDFAYFVNEKVPVGDLTPTTYIGVDNLLQNKRGITISSHVPKEGNAIAFKKGDILIGNIRPYLKKIWLATFDGGCSNDVLCIRNKGTISSSFLYGVLSQDLFFKYDMIGSVGSKMPRGDQNHIMDFPINNVYNSDKVGKVIVDITKKIDNNRAISKKLDSMIKIIYSHWFLQFEFPDKNGRPYKSSGGKMIWNNQLQKKIPDGWKVMKLNDFVIEEPKSKIKVNEVFRKGTVPFFTSGKHTLYTTNYLVDGMHCYLNTGGNADVKNFYGKASYSTDTWCLTGDNGFEYVLPLILDGIKSSMDIAFFQGTGLKHLQKNLLLNYQVCIPDNELLQKFVNIASNVYRKQGNIERENIKLEKFKNVIIPLFLNGQISIN